MSNYLPNRNLLPFSLTVLQLGKRFCSTLIGQRRWLPLITAILKVTEIGHSQLSFFASNYMIWIKKSESNLNECNRRFNQAKRNVLQKTDLFYVFFVMNGNWIICHSLLEVSCLFGSRWDSAFIQFHYLNRYCLVRTLSRTLTFIKACKDSAHIAVGCSGTFCVNHFNVRVVFREIFN